MQPTHDLLTLPEAASLLRLKVSTLRAWRSQHRIPFVKLGRRVFICRSDAEALITSSLVPARASALEAGDHAMPTDHRTKQERKANDNADQNSQPLPQQ